MTREPGLDPDVIAALESAKSAAVPPDARARVAARLARSIASAAPAETTVARAPTRWTGAQIAAPVVAFVAGLAAGAIAMRAPSRVVYVDRVVASPAPSATSSEAPAALPSAAPVNAPPVASASGSGTPRGTLAEEQAVLDVARAALGRGDGASALDAATTHAKRFPNGVLSPEREAIAIRALILSRRTAEAQARAERFRRAYPTSALLPAVLDAVGTHDE